MIGLLNKLQYLLDTTQSSAFSGFRRTGMVGVVFDRGDVVVDPRSYRCFDILLVAGQ